MMTTLPSIHKVEETMASSSSSSSPTKKKTAKFSQTQQNLFKKASSSKATSLTKRRETVFKKAYELSILCGIEVCVICYGSDGKLKTWPEDIEKVKDMARRYSELSETKRRKGRVDLRQFLEKINTDDSKKKQQKKKRKVRLGSNLKYPDWDPRFDTCSVEQLRELIQSLERNLTRLQHRFRAVVEAQKQRNMQNMNMADQEQRMMTTAPTMKHPQQHSNQVSMYLFNHGNGTFSKIPVSASAFNQGQSLAPIPNSLTIYPNSNAENHSGLLGVQETGVNGFQNMNMVTYSNNDSVDALSKQILQNCKVGDYSGLLGVQDTGTNVFKNTNMHSYNNFNDINVEDYLGLLGVQDTGINGLQNMNMCGYNNNNINTNGLSHQLVQFPNQRAAQAFRFGSAHTQY